MAVGHEITRLKVRTLPGSNVPKRARRQEGDGLLLQYCTVALSRHVLSQVSGASGLAATNRSNSLPSSRKAAVERDGLLGTPLWGERGTGRRFVPCTERDWRLATGYCGLG